MTLQDEASPTPTAPAPTGSDRALWNALRALFAFSGLLVALSLVYNFRGNWSIWKQGDWLINSINGPIRRGPSGTVIIKVSDQLGVTPVTVVIGLQVVLAGLLYVGYYLAVRGLEDARVALLLSCSSAMFLVFWPANIYHGALRKELLGMVALALLLAYLRKRQIWLVVLAGVIMTTGVWAHEIVILFGPAFVYLAWRATKLGHARIIWAITAVAAVSGVLAGLYTLRHVTVDDVHQVCDPLISRGLDSRICSGPVKWLGADSDHTLNIVQKRNANPSGLALFAVVLVLSAAPLAYLSALLENRKIALIGLLAALPMLPLFVIVIDWGRWLSCGVMAFASVLIAHALTDGLPLRRRPAVPVVLAMLALGCLIAPFHINDVVVGGIFSHALDVVRDFWHSI
ncbi:hypothetical protein BH11ACT8_BH11ACT8_27620 [soil metagenome]